MPPGLFVFLGPTNSMADARLVVGVGVLALAACAPEPPAEPARYTIEQFLGSTAISGAGFSHDESKILYSSDENGTFNAYSVGIGGGEPVQLTDNKTENFYAESYFPNDDRVLLAADQGGNERYHLFVRELDGSVRDLTPGEETRALFLEWSADRNRLYYTSNQRDPEAMDLYAMEIEGLTSKLLFANDENFYVGPVSPDERFVALTELRTDHDADIYLHEFASGKTRLVTKHEGDVSNLPSFFGPDGKWLYFISDDGAEFPYAARLNVQTLEKEVVEQADWGVVWASRSRTGKYVFYSINADARSEIRLYQMDTGERVTLPQLPPGSIVKAHFSSSEEKLLLLQVGDRTPGDLHVLDLADAHAVRVTASLNPEIEPADLVDTEVVRYASFDGVEIPAILLRPNLEPGERAPAIVDVHGGPGGQSRTGYSALYQYLANHGYVILRVNNRGSSGYGKTFFKMDDRKHGDADLKDCIWGKKYLQSLDYVDPEKIGIMGGSYGGYMVLAALAFSPDEFDVGVDIFGVANWLRTLKSIPPWWKAMRSALYEELGDPEKDAEYLRKISPLFHADQIRKPLMVLQGANDPRVLKVESDEIVEAVKSNGVPVEYLVFEDEGHGFKKKANRIRGYEGILRFLDAHLKGGG